MSFEWSSPGLDGSQSFTLLPEKTWFQFKIVSAAEATTKNGDPMVKVKAEVINDPSWSGKWVFTNVTFLPEDRKGSGMAAKFLKSIGEPWEKGKQVIDVENWVDSSFRGYIITTEYNGRKRNEIQSVEPTKEDETLSF